MACPRAVHIPTFVGGGLDDEIARAMRAHIEECESCFLAVAAAAAVSSQQVAVLGPSSDSVASGTSFTGAEYFDRSHGRRSSEMPEFIGPYAVQAIIGEGGMGTVYRALDPIRGELVAVKTVRVPTRPLFESLRQEIQLLSQMRHPGVVRVLGYDLGAGDPWYAMELIPGQTLATHLGSLWGDPAAAVESVRPSRVGRPIAANGKLAEIVALFRRLCDPVDALHRVGIVHCDLKPSNILLRGGTDPVLLDFGLVTYARGAVDRESLALVAPPRGTLAYVAPEVLQGQVPDPRADVYALGCILYEAVTGKVPFSGARNEIVEGHLRHVPREASELVDGVPPALDALLSQLLAKDVRDRVSNVTDAERALALLAGAPELGRARHTIFFRPQLVGRTLELERMGMHIDRLREGRGALVLVAGESGIGKTSFANEAARRATARRVKVVVGECAPPAPQAAGSSQVATATSALSPLRQYFEFLRDCCREQGTEALDRLLGDTLPVLAPYSPALASLKEQVAIPELSKLPLDAGRDRLLSALVQTLAAATEQAPLLLVIDDVQWADELTLALFEALRAKYLERLPLLVLATYRSEERPLAVNDLASKPEVDTITLERLERAAVATMVRDMVGIDEPERDLIEFVYSHAEGVPFFTAEYLRSIVSEGLLTRADSGWRLAQQASASSAELLQKVPFPVRLADLIRKRTAGLSEAAFLALQAGAALGREFQLDVLAAALGVTAERAALDLEEARLRQIVASSGEGTSFRFAHDKFRERIYAEVPDGRRRSLHGAAARALELRYRNSAELEYSYGDIARHFRLAGDTQAAIDYFEKAAERALRISADAEALQFLNATLELERDTVARVAPRRRATWEREVAEALHGLGRVAQSAPPLERAAALLGHPIPGTPAALALTIAAHLLRRLIPERVRSAPADPEKRRAALEMGRVLERVLRISYYTGNNLQLLYACVASLTFCEHGGPSADLATAYSNAAATASILPIHSLAQEYFKRASDLLARTESPVEESQLRMLEGCYYMGLGNQKKAIAISEAGMQVARNIGFHRRNDECTAIRCSIDIHAGRHGLIEQRTAQIESSATLRGDSQMLSWAHLQRLEGMVMRGAFREACDHLAVLWPLFGNVERAEKIWILGFAAYARYRGEQRTEALDHADRAAELVKQGALVQLYCVNPLDRLAELRMLRWREHEYTKRREGGELEKAAARACNQLRQLARMFPFGVPGACLQTGLLHWARGQREKARHSWQEGARAARGMELTYHEARLLLALGKGAKDRSTREAAEQRCMSLLTQLQIPRSALVLDHLVSD